MSQRTSKTLVEELKRAIKRKPTKRRTAWRHGRGELLIDVLSDIEYGPMPAERLRIEWEDVR